MPVANESSTEPLTQRHGVITLFGYGATIAVDRGHLTLSDRIGPTRRLGRFAKVGHGLRRIVAIGSEGSISLAALRWLADQNASFVLLNRDGRVLATTGPVSSSDVRLRRAQSLAHQSDLALRIARELIDQKLRAQEHVARKYFPSSSASVLIAIARNKLSSANSSDEIRVVESQGALAYWNAWQELPITFPRVDLPRVPAHWQRFGSRMSVLTNSPRLAVNPPNAMLNYLYAVLETESRLALAALGLDPALGVLHNDLRARDSLACDLMEPVRPQADSFLLDWLKRSPLKREWFFEKADGNCRLMASLASELSQSAEIWRRAVAPFAEGIAQVIWTNDRQESKKQVLPTLLTQVRRREARSLSPTLPTKPHRASANVCGICGKALKSKYKHCRDCAPTIWRENVQQAAKIGRENTHRPEAQARRAETQRRQNATLKAWNPANQPVWLDEKFYREKVQPRLTAVTVPTIQSALSVSEPYALRIRGGKCVPHPRHWAILARLSGS